jgi:hypothetical protein
MNIKGYYRREEKNKDYPHRFDYLFTSKSEDAAYYTTRLDAETGCKVLEMSHVSIPSSEGGFYTLRDFRVEEVNSDRFVIYCEGPFIPEHA